MRTDRERAADSVGVADSGAAGCGGRARNWEVVARRSSVLALALILASGCSYGVNGPPAITPADQVVRCDEKAPVRRAADTAGGVSAGFAGIMLLTGIIACDGGAVYPGCMVESTRWKAGLGLGAMAVYAVYLHALFVSGERLRECREAKSRSGDGGDGRSPRTRTEPSR